MGIKINLGGGTKGKSLIGLIFKHWKIILIIILLYIVFFEPEFLGSVISNVMSSVTGSQTIGI